MSFSIALTGFGLADCRKASKRVSVSLGRFMVQVNFSFGDVDSCGNKLLNASGLHILSLVDAML
jgi:hypothetical protein